MFMNTSKAKKQSTNLSQTGSAVIIVVLALVVLVTVGLGALFVQRKNASDKREQAAAEEQLQKSAELSRLTATNDKRTVTVSEQSEAGELDTKQILTELNLLRAGEDRPQFVLNTELTAVATKMATGIHSYYLEHPGQKITDIEVLNTMFNAANASGSATTFTTGLQNSCVVDAKTTMRELYSYEGTFLKFNTYDEIGIAINFNSWGACDIVFTVN